METLTDMGIFAKVVETQGFSSAAKTLNMSKSNVSRRIALLEDRLGIRLLQRTTRKLGLTDSGRVYYQHCTRVLAEMEQAENAINSMRSAPRGLLKVSLPETFGRSFVLPLLPEFMRRFPEVRIKLAITNRMVDLIEEGFDVAIRKGEIDDGSLIAVQLGQSQQHLYASTGYLEQNGEPKHPDDLKNHFCLSVEEQNGHSRIKLFSDHQSSLISVVPRMVVNDHGMIHQLVRDGMGISLVPGFLCNEDLHTGRLVRILGNWVGPSVKFNAVYPCYKGVAPNTKAFLDFIKDKLAKKRPWENSKIRHENVKQPVIAAVT
ncbi:LysR substrate-binding domain-containing protein [Pseudomonadota bacterium]